MAHFGEWLKIARENKGYSLRQLESRINKLCTFGYLHQLERGETGKKGQTYSPDIEIVDALAVALDKPIDDARLAAGYAPLHADPDGIYKALRELLPDRQEIAKRQIKAIIESLKTDIPKEAHLIETDEVLVAIQNEGEIGRRPQAKRKAK